MKELIKECVRGNYKQKGSFIDSMKNENDYYVVESEGKALRFWNSSNQQEPYNPKEILREISVELLEGETEGSLSDGWNEIMWEVV